MNAREVSFILRWTDIQFGGSISCTKKLEWRIVLIGGSHLQKLHLHIYTAGLIDLSSENLHLCAFHNFA